MSSDLMQNLIAFVVVIGIGYIIYSKAKKRYPNMDNIFISAKETMGFNAKQEEKKQIWPENRAMM